MPIQSIIVEHAPMVSECGRGVMVAHEVVALKETDRNRPITPNLL
jgi:hypothetical protein